MIKYCSHIQFIHSSRFWFRFFRIFETLIFFKNRNFRFVVQYKPVNRDLLKKTRIEHIKSNFESNVQKKNLKLN